MTGTNPLTGRSQAVLPKSVFFALFFFWTAFASAQTAKLPVFCGQEVFDYIVRRQYPDLHRAFQGAFEACAGRPSSGRSPLTIRVVVHVVWKNAEENLADSIILNQIAVLNEDYNRQNPDTAKLRPEFLPAAGNPQIRFDLAGIVRVQTNASFKLDLAGNELLANLKSSSQGGSDAWNPDAYLNLWICKIQPITIGGFTLGQILGFAFPPNNLGNWPANSGAPSPAQDGVALDYRVVGRNNPNTVDVPGGTGALVVRGRTATHEVGHYLGLRHIWGDGGILGLPNNCDQSDGIGDTPFANAQSPFDCNKSRNTCPQTEPHYGQDMPDLVENYMDYASEDCMNMFTRGQADLMQSVLAGPRKGLVAFSTGTSQADAEEWPFLFPNPARDGAWLQLPAAWQAATVDLIGADGRIRNALPTAGGEQRVDLHTRALAPGWYAVRVQTANRVWTGRLVMLP
ncbi:MAG: hypothetical protein IPH12_01200 [Saprospirales bacterium]|nr:hypothetical protein [Saprospirales bacterium]